MSIKNDVPFPFHDFGSGSIHALTMLYLQNQDLKGLSPEDLCKLYDETYVKLKKYHKEERHDDVKSWYNQP